MTAEVDIAIVVIGRNEGRRLIESLQSVRTTDLPIIYVDSGSSDGSPAAARGLANSVIELDLTRPCSAARGRNEGVAEALRLWPKLQFVMFLDGDCTLEPGFIAAASAKMAEAHNCAIVTGHLVERFPEASIYNRICAIEWRGPAGEIHNMNALGGIMLIRVSAFLDVGGFNEEAIAGEEPDLGVRLSLAGYSIIKIDEQMAVHDAQILTFRQWWIRAVRGGHALAHRYSRHGRTHFRDGRRELLSALFWACALPLAVVLLLWPTHGWSVLLLAGYLMFAWRVSRYYSRAGLSRSDAWLVTRFIIYAKFAHSIGVLRYALQRLRGRFQILEYK